MSSVATVRVTVGDAVARVTSAIVEVRELRSAPTSAQQLPQQRR